MTNATRGVVGCLFGLVGLSLGGPGPVEAQTETAQTRPVAKASPAPSLGVDLAVSRVYMRVRASGRLGHEHGIVGRLESGSIEWGGRGELVFAMRTFVADLPEARQYVGLTGSVSASDKKKTTDNMIGSDVLDAAKYPTATYKITSSAPLDGQAAGAPGRYKLDGGFTLHGMTRALALVAKVEATAAPGELRMTGSFPLVQTQYGMRPYSALGGLVGVADQIDVWGDFVLKPVATASKPVGPAVAR